MRLATRLAPERPLPGTPLIQGVLGSSRFSATLAVAAVAVFYTNFARYFGATFGVIIPLYWIVAFLAAAVAALAANWRQMNETAVPPIILWGYGYLVIALLWYIPVSGQTPAAEQHLQDGFLSVLFLAIMAIILSEPRAQHSARIAIAFAVVFAAGVNLYERLVPGAFSTDLVRSAGLYVNANQSAAAIVLGVICSHDIVAPRWRPALWVLSGLGVFLTLSRSGIIAWILVLLFSSIRAGPRGLLGLGVLVLVVALVLASLGGLEGLLAGPGEPSDDIQNRLDFFTSGSVSDSSAASRADQAALAWDMFVENPFLGYGTGASVEPPFDRLGPHNTYLALMVNYGIVGLFILPLLALVTWWGAKGAAKALAVMFCLFFLYWSLFSHNVLEEPYWLFGMALAAAVSATSRSQPDVPMAVRTAPGHLGNECTDWNP